MSAVIIAAKLQNVDMVPLIWDAFLKKFSNYKKWEAFMYKLIKKCIVSIMSVAMLLNCNSFALAQTADYPNSGTITAR